MTSGREGSNWEKGRLGKRYKRRGWGESRIIREGTERRRERKDCGLGKTKGAGARAGGEVREVRKKMLKPNMGRGEGPLHDVKGKVG